MKNYYLLFFALLILSCDTFEKKSITVSEQKIEVKKAVVPILNLTEANRLAQLPIDCIQTEYPNKLNQVIGGNEDLQSPQALHPAFYGCFDWHSAVHGHWSLVTLLKQFPELDNRDESIRMLLENISEDNIKIEVSYFFGKHNASYERTYGWAWLLKLAEELHTWDDPNAKILEGNLQPLTDLIVDKYLEFLPKLNYPIRVGEHSNTAFGLSFAYDYAKTVDNVELKSLIEQRAKDFYNTDTGCPLSWEPSGFDFLSPCLEEAALMKRVLSSGDYKAWLDDFLPQLKNKNFTIETGRVSDRSDGKLVHLDGVNFSRAWSLNEIAKDLQEYEHLKNISNKHINYSLPSIVGDGYEGGHWLGSFAIYALNSVERD
ncbi:DUF2891 domain-containing protein [Psychroserpens ponticola]|uniref:DUF2891 domain-containing protein n=1 Tax=Psychroserpens ponticola TaxID=2932268 RepID=A0ABY7RVZ3_9FLAO|nr:DUF2891 domain-containing protein [Psychroserpens ponticola]WCO00421.1 DUF2891 domain-containing protein [Psychroserpens ponticola]